MNNFNLRTPLELPPQEARQDKIEIHIGIWTIAAADQTLSEFVSFLGRSERSSNYPHRLFQATNENMFTLGSSGRVKILSSYEGVRPLISGQLKIFRRPGQRFTLRLQVTINPTRFCVYQPPTRRIGSPMHNNTHATLSTSDSINRYGDEYTLDLSDNVLLTQSAKAHASNRHYPYNFRRYISAMVDYINNEIREFRLENITLNREGFDGEYVLRRVENYWEFSDENPILKIKQLESSFRRLANSSLISEFSGIHAETELSAIGLRADLRAGERIKIYAKTNKRIRIEVEHKYKENPNLAEGRRMTTNSIEELWDKIIASSYMASMHANCFINQLRQITASSQSYPFKAINFITALYETVGNIAEAKSILSLFFASNGIPRAALTKQQRLIMDRLITRRLVQYQGRPFSRYYIHSYYAQSVSQVFPN